MARILIIDDDTMICETLVSVMQRIGYTADSACTLADGLIKVKQDIFDLIFLDVRLPDGNGLEALPIIRNAPSQPEVIIITGEGSQDGAELAIRNGAWDYTEKPPSLEKLTLQTIRALEYRKAVRMESTPLVLKRDSIIGSGSVLKSCLEQVAAASPGMASILIQGETGSGKELLARAVHSNSPRQLKPFVVIDCASLSENLAESILFGNVKGAFTGADRTRDGLVKAADNGVLFLDEVGEMPLNIQKIFLRVLQEHRFRQVGGKAEISSDFRLISATHRDLNAQVKAGGFRQDMLFRLRSIAIELPPLRKRGDDIKELAQYFMNIILKHYDQGTKGFSPEFLQALNQYHWPGNVRELYGAMENAIAVAGNSPMLFLKHLPVEIRVSIARSAVGPQKQHPADLPWSQTLGKLKEYREAMIKEAEEHYLKRLLQVCRANIQKACMISGLSRPRLYALFKKYNLKIA